VRLLGRIAFYLSEALVWVGQIGVMLILFPLVLAYRLTRRGK
jgi:hypothetical protein